MQYIYKCKSESTMKIQSFIGIKNYINPESDIQRMIHVNLKGYTSQKPYIIVSLGC